MSDRPRTLVLSQPLPEYDTPQERIRNAGHDVREAMLLVDKRLREYAQRNYGDGWDVDEAYASDTDARFHVANRNVVASLRLVRRG